MSALLNQKIHEVVNMKKTLALLIAVSLFLFNTAPVFASDYMVNPFYAIKSYEQYQKIGGTLKDSNHVYYGWGRIAMDSDGKMVFTNKLGAISNFDLNTEYFLPLPAEDGKLPNETYKESHPDSKNLLMVFLSRIQYQDGKDSAAEFLNMDKSDWDKYIIDPMLDMINEHGFDGVVLDLEGFVDDTGKYSGLRGKYNDFLEQLNDRLGDKILVVCVNVPKNYDGYDYSYIYSISDYIILLAYPYQHYTTYGQNDGPAELIGKIKDIDVPEAQPYGKIDDDLKNLTDILSQRYKQDFDSKKILLGTTLEVNGWIQKQLSSGSSQYTYYESTKSLDDGNKFKVSSLEGLHKLEGKVEYVPESINYKYRSMTFKKTVDKDLETGVKKIEYYYETPETIYDKYYSLVNKYNIGGISVWRIGLGDTDIWSGVNSVFDTPQGGYEEMPSKTDVAYDKVWAINFNMPVDKDSVKSSMESIAVVDSLGNMQDIKFEFSEKMDSIKVIPTNNYKPGQVYYLIIGNGIKSGGNIYLNRPARMKFSIEN